ncbi:MAG: 50S ribosomal protein L21 [Actinobacteria bacterium]|nr:MAG: 50S ribosomal protein L21 [Actinomycetota bacterium]
MATKTKPESYAIIAVGGKQYVVREGERLLVDRLATDEGKTFHPEILFVGGDGKAQLRPTTTVTARVVGHVLGDKVRIGKYRPKSGYRRHTGFRAKLSQIEIETIGAAAKRAAPAAAPKKEAPAAKPKEAAAAAQPPRGYADFTVAEISEKAKRWKLESVEAALDYERAHAKRKGALAALESALEAKKEK